MKIQNFTKLLLLILFLANVWACRKKDTDFFVREAPSLFFADGRTDKTVINNINVGVKINVKAQAIGELASVKVFREVNGQNETQIDEITTFENRFSTTFEYIFNTQAAFQIGDKVGVKFVATDKNGKTSEPLVFTVNIAGSLFSISQQVIGGNNVTVLAPPNPSTNITLINAEEFIFETGKKYLISGILQFEEGSKITFQPGAEIYAKTGETTLPAVVISPGIAVKAEGTKDAPILFTSDKKLTGGTPAAGDWQGVAIYGKARVNLGPQVGIANTTFGGTNDNDSSGVFKYIRIEYAGGGSGSGAAEPAGLHIGGVGSKTQISYIQVFKTVVHGFNINGGTVNLRYMVGTHTGNDHSFLIERGWRAYGQFWVVDNSGSTHAGRGIQITTYASAVSLDVITNFVISNVTLVGSGRTSGTGSEGMRFRRAAEGKMYNAIVTQMAGNGVRRDNDAHAQSFDGRLELRNSTLFENGTGTAPNYNNFHSSTRPGTPSATTGQNWRDNATYQNSQAVVTMTNNVVGTEATDAFDISTINSWFINAPFRGAVPSTNNWLADGSWCVDTSGNIL
jgi:hypothetical protein